MEYSYSKYMHTRTHINTHIHMIVFYVVEDQEKVEESFDCHFQMLRKTRGQDIQLQLEEAHSTFTEAYNNDLKVKYNC